MKIKNFFSKINIQIALSFLTFSLLMVISLSAIFYYSASRILSESREKQTHEAIVQTSDYVSAYLDKIKTLSNLIAMYPDISEILRHPEGKAGVGLAAMINISAASDPRIQTIAVIAKDGCAITSNSDMAMPLSKNMMDEEWYQAAIQCNQMPVITSIHHGDFAIDRDNLVISISQEVVDENKEHLGVVLIDISYRFIEDYLRSIDLGKNGYAYILDDNGKVLYHPNETVFENRHFEEELLRIWKERETSRNDSVTVSDIPNSNWKLIGVSSGENLNLLKKKLIDGMLFVNLLLIAASVILSWMISKKLTKPIFELQNAMMELDDNWGHIQLDPKSSLEITALAKEYNALLDRIKALTEDIAQKENVKRVFELKALQSQINPHFLYNTLDTILWLAEFGENDKVVAVSKSLAELLRLSLDIQQTVVPLHAELSSVENYLKIQQMRYEDKISYEIHGQEELLSIMVPKLILQPIVENAIYHGIRRQQGMGKVDIEYLEEDGDLILRVEDNGVGYFAAKEQEENNLIKTKLGGIGMKNVDQRIKLLYGERYGIRVEENYPRGTIIVYTLKGSDSL